MQYGLGTSGAEGADVLSAFWCARPRQRIWDVRMASSGWVPMADRGSITANHYDHVHISVF